ncbi:hypothetical protein MED297_15395 [Reinekea sp. MED297]|uniref:EF-hand domain-containing protein n=2 Tax=Reinekea TaxID=230494 RepID=A4BIZ4_9GAMM|nr:hypothetical protein MED297_15395 [Reinekea sp. MED297] [Reinekea blandensis MED297]
MENTMKKTLLTAAIMTTATLAIAEDALEFSAVDADSNGLISMEEAAVNEALLDSFSALDLDVDGNLTEDEFAAFTVASAE